jgi:hypothetical protein
MGYYLPDFNLAVNDWYISNSYANPPDEITIGNFSSGRRSSVWGYDTYTPWNVTVARQLLLPISAAVGTSLLNPLDPDVLEIPAGSGNLYLALDGMRVGVGFPNEHLVVLCLPLTLELLTGYPGHGVWPAIPAWVGSGGM